MKIKTSELTGPALDWAVAVAESRRVEGNILHKSLVVNAWCYPKTHRIPFSTDWAQGGPIIDAHIDLLEQDAPNQPCHAVKYNDAGEFSMFDHIGWHAYGPTKLVAAMRCLVASKLGDEVDVPEELL